MNINLDYSLTRSLTALHHGQNAVSARPHAQRPRLNHTTLSKILEGRTHEKPSDFPSRSRSIVSGLHIVGLRRTDGEEIDNGEAATGPFLGETNAASDREVIHFAFSGDG